MTNQTAISHLEDVDRWSAKELPNLRQIFDNLPQAVILADRENHIGYANSAAETLFDASAAHLKKGKLHQFIPANSPALDLVAQVHETRTPVTEYRLELSSPRIAGDKFFDVHAAPVPENPNWVILTIHERAVTDKIERQFSHQNAARSVGNLAAMLAHEIKNPLSGIRGAAQLLATTISDKDKNLTDLITTETDRIVNIVNRMEVFSDKRDITPAPVNMHEVLGHVKKLSEFGFAKGISIQEEYDPSIPMASGDHDQLIQVFLNLLKNAAEAVDGQKKRTIKLTSAYRSGISIISPVSKVRTNLPLEYCIKDSGVGVPAEIRNHIFDPFVTTRINGTGLGLALVAKIIGDHGGLIECESSPGSTTFRVMLPVWKGGEDTEGYTDV